MKIRHNKYSYNKLELPTWQVAQPSKIRYTKVTCVKGEDRRGGVALL
jgi:hypothetical protein